MKLHSDSHQIINENAVKSTRMCWWINIPLKPNCLLEILRDQHEVNRKKSNEIELFRLIKFHTNWNQIDGRKIIEIDPSVSKNKHRSRNKSFLHNLSRSWSNPSNFPRLCRRKNIDLKSNSWVTIHRYRDKTDRWNFIEIVIQFIKQNSRKWTQVGWWRFTEINSNMSTNYHRN